MLAEHNATDVEINKMTYENAMRWYHWDPFTHIAKDQATVGALRKAAEGHDVSIRALSHHKKDSSLGASSLQAQLDRATAQQK